MQKQNSFFDNVTSCLSSLALVFIFLVVGAGLCWWGWTILQNARASAAWPSVEGRITSADLDHSTDAEGGDSYSPEVVYAYVVDDLSYENEEIKFGENSYGSEREAQAILNRYPVGQVVVVFYDPAQPEKAVLEPGVSGGSYIVLGIGAVFVFVALLLPLFMGVRFFLGRRV